ncbi:cora-like Mg2+ transporter protein-domain-containing protein [Syncephalis fuscata]|nr:cora-like Mg2+ transporter protein-domain-containing protein [Syncephalis fuscata]
MRAICSYYFICFRSFDANPHSDTYLEPVSVFTVVMREGIILIYQQPTPHTRNVLRRIRQLTDYVTISPDWINYALIDDITDGFAPLIGNLRLEVDSIDELVLILKESEQSDMLRRIGYARKKVMTSMRLFGSKANVMRGLIKRCNDWAGDEIELYLDRLIAMLQNVAHYEKIIACVHGNYLAQIGIELTQSSNATNDIMSKLTVLATIIVPINVVTGLWGMNVQVPGQDAEGLAWSLESSVAW